MRFELVFSQVYHNTHRTSLDLLKMQRYIFRLFLFYQNFKKLLISFSKYCCHGSKQFPLHLFMGYDEASQVVF